MRNALTWFLGFALAFGAVFSGLMGYAISQPSLWLPLLVGIAFYLLLGFYPRVGPPIRAGAALIFCSISCVLWLVSSSDSFVFHKVNLQPLLELSLGVLAILGIGIAMVEFAKLPKNRRPSMGPLLFLMAFAWLISYYSSSKGGASPMIDWVIRHFGLSRESAETLVVLCRKAIHLTFYGLVACVAFATGVRNGAARRISFAAALLMTLLYASYDEMRQASQPDRGASVYDVLLDLTGGAVALAGIAAITSAKPARGPTGARKSSTL